MKTLLTILLCLYSVIVWNQRNNRDIPSIDLIYGYKILNRPLFDKNLDKNYSTFSHFKWSFPLQFVGVGFTLLGDSIDSGGKYFIGNAQIMAYLPQKVNLNDSLIVKSRGFNIGLTFFGMDAFPKIKNFDLIFNLGFDAGRILLTDQGLYQRNLYFSPKLSIQPKVKMGVVALSLVAEYGYDVTKGKWQRTWFGPRHQNQLTPSSNKIGGLSGLSWFITVGYALN